jgi:hypothetical protein
MIGKHLTDKFPEWNEVDVVTVGDTQILQVCRDGELGLSCIEITDYGYTRMASYDGSVVDANGDTEAAPFIYGVTDDIKILSEAVEHAEFLQIMGKEEKIKP